MKIVLKSLVGIQNTWFYNVYFNKTNNYKVARINVQGCSNVLFIYEKN